MGAVCQAALVLCGWLAGDMFARLAEQAIAAMAAANDAEVLLVADELRRATGVLSSTASALVIPMLGMLAWLAFLRPSGAAAAFFTEGASGRQRPCARRCRRSRRSALGSGEGQIVGRRHDRPIARPARRARLALGAFMLLSGTADALNALP
jgi:hypothetical protein